jgi:hypothetical protein
MGINSNPLFWILLSFGEKLIFLVDCVRKIICTNLSTLNYLSRVCKLGDASTENA